MKCPKCGEVMTMRVSIDIVLPASYVNQISKKAIASKECKITAAMWEKATATCFKCNYRVKSL